MDLIIRILLINLIISCENAGVFALATNGLQPETAKKVHRIGVILSLVFKLIFIVVASVLFAIPWLHIRIVGGALLLCITFNMLFRSKQTGEQRSDRQNEGEDNFFEAVISTSVAVISMSLDDAIAISGVISGDSSQMDLYRMMVALIGLCAGALILLMFSETITKLMVRFPVLNNLCAGCLTYMAIKMMFEDNTIRLFFEHINFTFAVPAAVLCGVLMTFYGMFASDILPGGDARMRKTNLPLCCIIVVYALATVGAISYLDTKPLIEGHRMNVQMVYGFIPSGANAIYTIASSAELITICSAILAGGTARKCGEKSYLPMLLSNTKGMLVYVFLGLFINTAGLSYMYGFGKINPPDYTMMLLVQILLLLSYTAAFTMISTFVKGKSMIIVLGLLFVLLEPVEAAVFICSARFPAVAYFFPSYHLAAVSGHMKSPYSAPAIMFISILYITLFSYIGYCRYQKHNAACCAIRQ